MMMMPMRYILALRRQRSASASSVHTRGSHGCDRGEQGPDHDFVFVMPDALKPLKPPKFRTLPSVLHMRLLLRVALEDSKRALLGWMRSQDEVR
jgi:hypothetical protein